jgi:hypothetical protein
MAVGQSSKGANYEYEFKQKKDLVFKLDSETTFDAAGPIIGADYFVFFNGPSLSFKYYDRKSYVLKKSSKIFTSGPDAIIQPGGVTLIDKNMAVYEFYGEKLKVLGESGNVIDTINTNDERLINSSTLITSLSPIIVDDQFIYLTAQGNHIMPNRNINHSDFVIKRVNRETRKVESFVHYPENYENPITGGRQSIIAITYNQKSKSLIISFPLDHNIYELKRNGELLVHEIPSPIFDSFEGHYFSSFTKLSKSSWPEVKAKFWQNYSYWAIHYDQYRDVYIRIVNLPIPSSVDISNESILESEVRKYIAIVYDKNFKLISISEPLKGLDLTMEKGKFFSTEEGFHVFSNDQNNEDVMRFLTFDIVKK